MALSTTRKEEVAERLRELRGPKPQQAIADAVGVTLRAYQAWEGAESGMHYGNLERLAAIFDVSENFLLYGVDTHPHGAGSQLDRIEAEISRLGVLLEALAAALETELGDRVSAAAKRAKQQDLDTPRAAGRRG